MEVEGPSVQFRVQKTISVLLHVSPSLWKGFCHNSDSRSGPLTPKESRVVSSPFTSIYSHPVFAFNFFAVQWPNQTDFFPPVFLFGKKSLLQEIS